MDIICLPIASTIRSIWTIKRENWLKLLESIAKAVAVAAVIVTAVVVVAAVTAGTGGNCIGCWIAFRHLVVALLAD